MKDRAMDRWMLTLLAHVSAQRQLLVNLHAYWFLEEPDPIGAAKMVREMFAQSPTLAPQEGSGLDPATSDLVAAMTDDAIQDVMDRVIAKLEMLQGIERHEPGSGAVADFLSRLDSKSR